MTMDVHNRFRTEAHQDVEPRFNERFILSLTDARNCILLDDELNILPVSSLIEEIKEVDGNVDNYEEKTKQELEKLSKNF